MIKINLLEIFQREEQARWRRRSVDAHDGNGRYGVAQTENPGCSRPRGIAQPGLLVPA